MKPSSRSASAAAAAAAPPPTTTTTRRIRPGRRRTSIVRARPAARRGGRRRRRRPRRARETGQGVERRRLEEVAASDVKGGLVPRAEQARAVQRARGQRAAVVRAAGRGRVEAAVHARQQDLLAAH